MKLEEIILTIEQAKHLQELGLDMSDAALYWIDIGGMTILPYWIVNKKNDSLIPTYTLQEVLDKLPMNFKVEDKEGNFRYAYLCDDISECLIRYEVNSFEDVVIECAGNTFFEAVYKMLCWVIKKGYLKEDKK